MEIPLNKQGEGPEMDYDKIVKTVWQIWDANFATIAEHSSEEEAKKEVVELYARKENT